MEEAVFFHAIARQSPTRVEIKGRNPLTENYSVLRPEVMEDASGQPPSPRPTATLVDHLLSFDEVIVAGEAKSHCVAWTVEDLLAEIRARDPRLARRVVLLDDCTSPVVVPGVVDFTDAAEAAYARFAAAGMRARSTESTGRSVRRRAALRSRGRPCEDDGYRSSRPSAIASSRTPGRLEPTP